jgi:hypothetical protein
MENSTRIAVFYHFFEVNETYRDNLIFFLSTAYYKEIDFYIIISGNCSISLPTRDNIMYIRTENKNYDFGGYIVGISQLESIQKYDIYIFINSSVRGPFLSNHFKEENWTKLFINLLSEEVKLVGSSINILSDRSIHAKRFKEIFTFPGPFSHIQTTAYALDRISLSYLLKIGFYDNSDKLDKRDVICRYEIRMTQEITANGWNIKCFIPEYNGIDYRFAHSEINYCSRMGNILYEGAYFGRTAHPTELAFVKTNGRLMSEAYLASHTYTALRSNEDRLDWAETHRLEDRAFERIEADIRRRRRWSGLLDRFRQT